MLKWGGGRAVWVVLWGSRNLFGGARSKGYLKVRKIEISNFEIFMNDYS